MSRKFKKVVQDLLEKKGISFTKKNTIKQLVNKLEKRISSKYKYYRYTVKELRQECDELQIKYKKNKTKKLDLIEKLIKKHETQKQANSLNSLNEYFKCSLHNLKINTFYKENIHLEYRYSYYFSLFKDILEEMPKNQRIEGIGFLIFSYTLEISERYFIGKKIIDFCKPRIKLRKEQKANTQSKEELLLLCKEIGILNMNMKTNIRSIRDYLYRYSYGFAVNSYQKLVNTNTSSFIRILETYLHGSSYCWEEDNYYYDFFTKEYIYYFGDNSHKMMHGIEFFRNHFNYFKEYKEYIKVIIKNIDFLISEYEYVICVDSIYDYHADFAIPNNTCIKSENYLELREFLIKFI